MSGFAAYKCEVLSYFKTEWDWMHDVIVRCWNAGLGYDEATHELSKVARQREFA